jgi:hypothetical protein
VFLQDIQTADQECIDHLVQVLNNGIQEQSSQLVQFCQQLQPGSTACSIGTAGVLMELLARHSRAVVGALMTTAPFSLTGTF